MKLIRETVENVKYLTEASENGKKHLYIEGTFLVGDKVNRNNRMYKMDTLRSEVERYNDEFIKTNRALGELGHPDTPTINLERVSHKIVSLVEDGDTDIVADPSAPGAFVNGIMENKEWMFVEGRFVEADFDKAKKQIKSASKQQIEEVALQIFENYLRKL